MSFTIVVMTSKKSNLINLTRPKYEAKTTPLTFFAAQVLPDHGYCLGEAAHTKCN